MPINQKDIIVALRGQGMSFHDIAQIAKVKETYARTVCSRTNRKKKPTAEDMCRYCGAKLTHITGKKHKQFCSDKCRSDWHNQQSQHKPYVRVCEYCGNEFVSFGYPNKRFCSRDCRTLAERKGERNGK